MTGQNEQRGLGVSRQFSKVGRPAHETGSPSGATANPKGEPIKISTLQSRYGLNSRQAVNNRINALFDRASLARGTVTPEQLDLLDRLDIHIRGGGAIADFPIQPEVQRLDKLDKFSPPDRGLEFDDDGISAINVMADLMEKMMVYATSQKSPLTNYEELEKAIANKWLLPSSKVRELIGTIPKTVKEVFADGDVEFFARGSFLFVKIGKIGKETSWAVEKSPHRESNYLLN